MPPLVADLTENVRLSPKRKKRKRSRRKDVRYARVASSTVAPFDMRDKAYATGRTTGHRKGGK